MKIQDFKEFSALLSKLENMTENSVKKIFTTTIS